MIQLKNKQKTSFCYYHRLFAWMVYKNSHIHDQAVVKYKKNLFSNLHGTVLELGPGTGTNLPYFPKNINWVGIEPNPFVYPYLFKKAEQLGLHIQIQRGTAEQIPFLSDSIDFVISTIVLCSVRDLSATLREIQRILRPGGRFLFIEHVAANHGTLLRRIQHWFCPIWKLIGDGCHPDREMGLALKNAKFEKLEYETFNAPLAIPIVRPHIAGIGIK